MTVLRPLTLIAFAAMAASAAPARNAAASSESCVVTRILADGREIRSVAPPGAAGFVSTRRGGGARASASARSSGRASASSSSSSSASSSSSSGRRSFARAVSSYTDEAGRTVTTTKDGRGCTIVVDERDIEGEE